MTSRFVVKLEKCCKYAFLGGSTQIITILHKVVIEIYYNITMGGVSRDPKFVLRNIWTAPNR